MVVEYINNILEISYWRILIIMVTGVFAGYLLQPVPQWFNDLCDNSYIFKLSIFILMGMTIEAYPLSWNKILTVVSVSVLVLTLFEHMRKYDKSDKK